MVIKWSKIETGIKDTFTNCEDIKWSKVNL